MKDGGEERCGVSDHYYGPETEEQTAIDSMQSIISTAGLTLHLCDPAETLVSDLTGCCRQFSQPLPVASARFRQLSAEIAVNAKVRQNIIRRSIRLRGIN